MQEKAGLEKTLLSYPDRQKLSSSAQEPEPELTVNSKSNPAEMV